MRRLVGTVAAGLLVTATGAAAAGQLVTPLTVKPVVLETPAAPAAPVVTAPEPPARAARATVKKSVGKRAKAGPKPQKAARKSPANPARQASRR